MRDASSTLNLGWPRLTLLQMRLACRIANANPFAGATRQARRPTPADATGRSPSCRGRAKRPADEGEDGQDQEDEKEDLCGVKSKAGHQAETEQRRDEGDNQEHDR